MNRRVRLPVGLALLATFRLAIADPPVPDCHPTVSIDSVREALSRPELAYADAPTVSPQNAWLAYTVQGRQAKTPACPNYLDNGLPAPIQGSRIILASIPPGQQRPLCAEDATCFHPSWSPDGKRLAYFSDEGGKLALWTVDVRPGGKTAPRRLTAENIKVGFWAGDEPRWSPDGRKIYVSRRSDENLARLKDCEKAGHVTDETDHGAGTFQRENIGEIVAIDSHGGQVLGKPLVPEDAHPAPNVFRLSPSGKWMSYLSVPRPRHSANDPVHDLSILRVTPGKGGSHYPRLIGRDLDSPDGDYNSANYRWHPKDDRLVFVKDGALWLLDLRHNPFATPQPLHPEVTEVTDSPLFFSPDGQSILVGCAAKRADDAYSASPTKLVRVPLEAEQPIRSFALPPGARLNAIVPGSPRTFWSQDKTIFAASVNTGGKTELLGFQGPDSAPVVMAEGGRYTFFPRAQTADGPVAALENVGQPRELTQLDGGLRPREPLTHLAVTPREADRTVVRTLITPVTLDQVPHQLKTTLLLPGGLAPGAKPPTVVVAYGGEDLGTYADRFGGGNPAALVPGELLLRLGYAVALVDLPMGPMGTGAETRAGEPMKRIADALLPQLDTLSRSQLVDPDRFAIAGQSYGGYTVAAALVQTDRFKAAIASSGIYDLKASPWRDWAIDGQGRMGMSADTKEAIARYERNSPATFADRIRTPLLLVHGTADDHFAQAEKLAASLAERHLGELAPYAGEGHSPPSWSLADHTDAAWKAIAFLQKNLGPGACPASPIGPNGSASSTGTGTPPNGPDAH